MTLMLIFQVLTAGVWRCAIWVFQGDVNINGVQTNCVWSPRVEDSDVGFEVFSAVRPQDVQMVIEYFAFQDQICGEMAVLRHQNRLTRTALRHKREDIYVIMYLHDM
jgi:hypothetical protein